MTPLARYRAVNDAVFRLYDDGDHAEALALIAAHAEDLADWDSELAVLAACLHGRLDDPRSALDALAGAADRGGWWDPRLLAEDDDLAALRDLEGYDDLLALSRDRWRRAHEATDRSGDVVVAHDEPIGLLVALHGAEEDAGDAAAAWGPVAAAAGLTLLAVRSSQRSSPRYRSWPDPVRARSEVLEAWSRLPAAERHRKVVLAGFSAGGRVALQLALDPQQLQPPVAAVLAVAPAIGPDDLPTGAERRSGAVWVGADDDLLPRVEAARPRLEPAGITVEVLPGCGHVVPPDLPHRALRALRTLTNEDS